MGEEELKATGTGEEILGGKVRDRKALQFDRVPLLFLLSQGDLYCRCNSPDVLAWHTARNRFLHVRCHFSLLPLVRDLRKQS